MKRQKGFTLIELLVVIAIIGILSSVVVASLNSARQKARDARRVDDVKQLQLALDLYFDANSGKYPYALSALKDQNFIPQISTPPAGAGDPSYKYVPTKTCTSYHLGVTLEDSGHIALQSKKNDPGTETVSTTGCPTGSGTPGTNFSGTGATTYDVVP